MNQLPPLDPISTLILHPQKQKTLRWNRKKIILLSWLTHNMQQAVRVSDNTAFFLLGEVVEQNDTEKLCSIPADKKENVEDYITGRFG